MSPPPTVPPIKCQGIKTKLVGFIQETLGDRRPKRWIEPFCGSCVVALNIRPKRALLCDTNIHIVRLYQDIQKKTLTPAAARAFLEAEGALLASGGMDRYLAVRERFNKSPNSLDFLFLNRSCFNGLMRFNRKGGFNVPFGHKPKRFARAYITKIVNQISRFAAVLEDSDWKFEVSDFRSTLAAARSGDLVYADPPYAGRHVDYFNSWSADDEAALVEGLRNLPCDFILSTWHSNQFRENTPMIESWKDPRFSTITRAHFYHVGAAEDLRHPMLEALVTTLKPPQ